MDHQTTRPAAPVIPILPIASSNIAGHGYHPESRTLAVQFKRGSTYHYADVPADVAEAFAKAESAGSFFASHIRGKFTSTELDAPSSQQAA